MTSTHRRWDKPTAIEEVAFKPASRAPCQQWLTCLRYHPGQRWGGAERPTASSHLRLQRSQREHCNGAWQAASPSPGRDHLQGKVWSPSARLSSLQHLPLLAGVCAATEIQSANPKHYLLIRWDRLLITAERKGQREWDPGKEKEVHSEHPGSRNPGNGETLEATFSLSGTEFMPFTRVCVQWNKRSRNLDLSYKQQLRTLVHRTLKRSP